MKIFPVLIFGILLLGCNNSSTKWERVNEIETTLHHLDGSRTTLELPIFIKKSSRYRLKYDLPHLQKDSNALLTVQRSFEMMEFEDSDLDIFVDTLSKTGLIFIAESPKTSLNKAFGNLVNSQLSEQFRIRDLMDDKLIITKKQAGFRKGGSFDYLKFKFFLDYSDENDLDHFQNLYFFTTEYKTYFIFEMSPFEEDLEQYYWTIKD